MPLSHFVPAYPSPSPVAVSLWMTIYYGWLGADFLLACHLLSVSSCAAGTAHTLTYLTASSGLWVPTPPGPLSQFRSVSF